jgi:hypothetical protein
MGITMLQLNSLNSLRWLGLGAAALGLASCDPPAPGPTSIYALDVSVETGGRELLGAWHGELDGDEAYVHVVDAEGEDSALQTVLIGHRDGEGHSGRWAAAIAIPARINDTGYLSVKLVENQGRSVGEQDFLILRYRTARDHRHVSLYAMDEDLVAQAIKNHQLDGSARDMRISADPEVLVRFIESTGGQDLFSVQIGYLERVSEDDIPPTGPTNQR